MGGEDLYHGGHVGPVPVQGSVQAAGRRVLKEAVKIEKYKTNEIFPNRSTSPLLNEKKLIKNFF